jgi:hypothetical protein
VAVNRAELVLRGQRLEYFTIGYNSLEGLISIAAGAIAGSVSLVGFGLDSLVRSSPAEKANIGRDLLK